MKYNPTDTSERTDEERRATDAELFAEILSRLDEKQQDERNRAERQTAVQSINLEELFYYLLSKLHLILAGMIAGAVLLGCYAAVGVTPVYTATSKLYIMGSTGSSIIADLQIGSVLAMDYQEVFKTWEVHEMVNEELGTYYSYSTLQSMLTVSNPEDTRILYITVKHPDAQAAADIANAYANAAKRFIVQTMKTDEPSTFSVALVPSVASSASVTSYVIRGFILGTLLVGGVLVLIFLMDNRPKSPDDIMRSANIPTLAVIPASPELSGAKKQRKKADRS
jgi:capsular polysaccharide biosynthesis protein